MTARRQEGRLEGKWDLCADVDELSVARLHTVQPATHCMSHDTLRCSKQYVQILSDVCTTINSDSSGHALSLRFVQFRTTIFRNEGSHSPTDTASHPRRLHVSSVPLWEPKMFREWFQAAILQLHNSNWDLMSVSRRHVVCERTKRLSCCSTYGYMRVAVVTAKQPQSGALSCSSSVPVPQTRAECDSVFI